MTYRWIIDVASHISAVINQLLVKLWVSVKKEKHCSASTFWTSADFRKKLISVTNGWCYLWDKPNWPNSQSNSFWTGRKGREFGERKDRTWSLSQKNRWLNTSGQSWKSNKKWILSKSQNIIWNLQATWNLWMIELAFHTFYCKHLMCARYD